MSQQTQRVRLMIEGYIELWKKGYTPIQIAEHFQVCKQTMYNSLQEIADKNGYSRNELLEAPEHSGPKATYNNPLRKEAVNAGQLLEEFSQAKEEIEKLINKIYLMEDAIK